MSGYVSGATSDIRPLGDAIQLVGQNAARQAVPIQFFAFGAKISPIQGGLSGALKYATPVPYSCKSCDNQESHIDAVLNEIAHGDRSVLNVVVSDLWLDNAAFAGSPQVALGGPLTEILRQGRTIGLIGLRAPFRGKITDFPVKAVYTGASEHPLFILLIGPERDVAAVHQALADSDSPAFKPSRRRYSLFSLVASDSSTNAGRLAPLGGGVQRSAAIPPERLSGIQQFVMKRGAATAQHGRIQAVFDAGEGVSEGAVWSGPLTAWTRVWKLTDIGALKDPVCRQGAWLELDPLHSTWRQTASSSADFSITPDNTKELLPDYSYFVLSGLGVKHVDTPNPVDQWMRDWSFAADQEAALLKQRPNFFPTLNLSDLATSMEIALTRATQQGVDRVRFGFVMTFQR